VQSAECVGWHGLLANRVVTFPTNGGRGACRYPSCFRTRRGCGTRRFELDRRLGAWKALICMDLRTWGRLRNVPFRSGTFRNFPFRSVSFRSVPGGSERTPYCLVPGAECLPSSLLPVARRNDGCRGRGVCDHVCALRNRKGIVGQGLTRIGAARNRGETFRFVPELSETFRFVPFRSLSFRTVAGAWKSRRQEDFGRERADSYSRIDGL